ncbi:MAG TPA: MaoC/PaaZ C-terminal domain-containing protein [Pirellulaceae bacterium]|jgi:acyl dehydratase|nr:MaoC/PaaZ C-terminal domain-containing protein [Pirellulaceae bacterium]
MSEPFYFDELTVGDCWESRSRTITETDVVNFAGMTGDYDPLHVDHEFAKQTPFGRPIAHGLLGLALLAGLSSTAPAMQTKAFLGIGQWKFLRPLFIGDTVRVKTEVIDLNSKNRRQGRVTWRRQLVNQADEVIQQGEFETIVACTSLRVRRDDGRTGGVAGQETKASAQHSSTTDEQRKSA